MCRHPSEFGESPEANTFEWKYEDDCHECGATKREFHPDWVYRDWDGETITPICVQCAESMSANDTWESGHIHIPSKPYYEEFE